MTTTDSWATITSSSRSTILPDSISTVNGTNNADTIRTKPIDHTVRAIYGNSGNDLIDISGNYGILWSESTIKGGNGKDSIYIYADIDGIHPATVTIDSGADSDIISIYGGYQGVHGGTVGMKNRSSVSINSGTGNDTVFIRGGEKGIDISNVKISGGAGNDLISIQGGKYGIGGVSGYGNATVQIDGGNGADTIAINSIDTLSNVTITAGSGDVINVGSGNADYFFDSTGEVTINGAVFKSNSANTSAKIKTSSNSITLSNGWNGEVKISNNIKLTDSAGKVINTSGSYSITNGKANSETNNEYKIIRGTNGNDSIEVYGLENVSIYTGAGTDVIEFPYDSSWQTFFPSTVHLMDISSKDRLSFPGMAFYYSNYLFTASLDNGNLKLKNDFWTIIFDEVTSTSQIKNIGVTKWRGETTTLGALIKNTISGGISTLPGDNNETKVTAIEKELKVTSIKTLNDFMLLGAGTDNNPIDTSNELADKVSKSAIDIVRMMGKIFGYKTQYKLDANGNPVLDSNGKKIEDDSTSKKIIDAGFSALLNIDAMLTSAKKIASGNLSDDELRKEKSEIVKQVADLAKNIANVSKSDKAGDISSISSAAVNIVTDIVNTCAGGFDKNIATDFIESSSKILASTIKLLGKDKLFKDTHLGTWMSGKAAGTKIESFVENYVGQTITKHIGAAVGAGLGVYSAINTYMESAEKYDIAGLPKSSATINKTIDVMTDITHSAGNTIALLITGGFFDADDIFKGMYTVTATVKYSFERGWTMATGGDVSKVKFQVEERNFAEIIGDSLKKLFTGTTKAKDVFNDEDGKKIYTEGNENNQITNIGSHCTINTDAGNDVIFNGEGTKSNYIDGGNNDDTVAVYGSNNTVKGGQGNDRISLYSESKAPSGSNKLYGETGDDFIRIDDTKYSKLPRKSHNTIVGGEGDDTIDIEKTNIPVVISYRVGDGYDVISGYDNNDTIKIVNSNYTTQKSGKDIIITVSKGKITLEGAKGKTLNIEEVTNDALQTGLSYDKKKTTVTAKKTFRGEKIDLTTFPSSVTKVNASALVNPANIIGNTADNSIKAGKGNDTISGGKGKDTLIGGDGHDTISGGNDADSVEGGKGDDSLNGGAGNDIIRGGDDKDTILGGTGDDKLYGDSGKDSLSGGKGNDSIWGGSGNDTLIGGIGNDSLWGNSGADTFIYYTGDGHDVIFGFDNKDTLTLDSLTFTSIYSKKNKAVMLNFDSGSITLKDFGSTSTFNINGTNYKISGTSLVKK